MVNSCKSVEELEDVVDTIAAAHLGEVPGKEKGHNGERQKNSIKLVVEGKIPSNALTRNYGIRQQAVYLRSKTL